MAVRKKLLLVNDILQGGGVEKLMHDFVWHWHERYDLTVLTLYRGTHAETILPPDVPYYSIELRRVHIWGIGRFNKLVNKVNSLIWKNTTIRRVTRGSYCAVLAMKEGVCMQYVAGLKRIPIKFAWVHTDYENYNYTYDLFQGTLNERLCMQNFKNVVCVSEQIQNAIRKVIGDPGNLIVRYNPLHVEKIPEMAQETVVDIEPEERENGPLFVTVGRLNYQKGYDILLEACHMLERDGLAFHVLIVGGEEPWGDEHNRLYRKHRKLGLTSVRFLGGRSNPYKYMKHADWFISSSIFEGYSYVSQEAAVLDVPMLLTDCSGVREFLGDSEYGIVMDISVLSIYENMKRVIEHPELREHYQKKIMERKKIVNFDERIAAIEELFDKDQAE